HLIRILNTLGSAKLAIFNERFRKVSPFGNSTIRRFAQNVSELKKMAGRDFEDILQCLIPCFEGLLDLKEDEQSILDLLYVSVYWHGLAKLRMHTDSSLAELELVTKALGNCLRHFADITCQHYKTVETDKEYSTRKRTEARAKEKSTDSAPTAEKDKSARRARTFNLETTKIHQLGYYVPYIKEFGTTDSYSTQIGELEHRVVKRRYGQTNHQAVVDQIVDRGILELVHDRMMAEYQSALLEASDSESDEETEVPNIAEESLLPPCRIAMDQKAKIHVPSWISSRPNEPAFKNFIPRLKTHLLTRLSGTLLVGDEPKYTNDELNQIDLDKDLIYPHATAAFNYTTYDVRRDHDTINTNTTRCDVMVAANDETDYNIYQHQFWYARVHGVFHANVLHGSFPRQKTRMEFLFVRWFGSDPDWTGGPSSLRLDRVGFVAQDDPSGAFGFLEPDKVIRACHLIPAYSLGKTHALLNAASQDMLMRYLGLGIGHNNSANFRGDAGMLKAEVLVENDNVPWAPPRVVADLDPADEEAIILTEDDRCDDPDDDNPDEDDLGFEY
ncbi:hypothetical protein C8J56DRAFT_1102833, partial [Mycena floridula]